MPRQRHRLRNLLKLLLKKNKLPGLRCHTNKYSLVFSLTVLYNSPNQARGFFMNRKRFIIEMGTGAEQHGQDVTKAAVKAVKDAITRVSLVGLLEMVTLEDLNDMLVEVLVACPHPDEVNAVEVLRALPFGQKEIKVVEGGMVVHGSEISKLEDKSDEVIVANAAVTVSLDVEKITIRG